MKHKLTRQEKARLLESIKNGKASIEIFRPGKMYIFITNDKDPNQYRMDGKIYNKVEYLAFCEKEEKTNNRGIIWNEHHQYEPDKILLVKVKRGKERLSQVV